MCRVRTPASLTTFSTSLRLKAVVSFKLSNSRWGTLEQIARMRHGRVEEIAIARLRRPRPRIYWAAPALARRLLISAAVLAWGLTFNACWNTDRAFALSPAML